MSEPEKDDVVQGVEMIFEISPGKRYCNLVLALEDPPSLSRETNDAFCQQPFDYDFYCSQLLDAYLHSQIA